MYFNINNYFFYQYRIRALQKEFSNFHLGFINPGPIQISVDSISNPTRAHSCNGFPGNRVIQVFVFCLDYEKEKPPSESSDFVRRIRSWRREWIGKLCCFCYYCLISKSFFPLVSFFLFSSISTFNPFTFYYGKALYFFFVGWVRVSCTTIVNLRMFVLCSMIIYLFIFG